MPMPAATCACGVVSRMRSMASSAEATKSSLARASSQKKRRCGSSRPATATCAGSEYGMSDRCSVELIRRALQAGLGQLLGGAQVGIATVLETEQAGPQGIFARLWRVGEGRLEEIARHGRLV